MANHDVELYLGVLRLLFAIGKKLCKMIRGWCIIVKREDGCYGVVHCVVAS